MNERQKVLFALAVVLIISVPLLFAFLGSWSFFDPDEGRYGLIPHGMILRGDFVTPTINHFKFFDKPPLLYWGIAASYKIFGTGEFGARFIPALAALLGILMAFALGKSMFGLRAGFLSAIILATSAIWAPLGRVVVTDMLLSALIFTAGALWWLARDAQQKNQKLHAIYLDISFAVALALATLTKGPIAIFLCGGAIFFYALFCRRWRDIWKTQWLIVLPLLAIIAVPWFWIVAARNPEFNHYFWYDQHIARFLGKTTGNDHIEGFWYFFALLPLLVFPWSLFAPAAIFAAWKRRLGTEKTRRAITYLLCGAGFIILFFSASKGKLVTYILPAIPFIAVMMGGFFDWLCRQQNFDQDKTQRYLMTAGKVLLVLILLVASVSVLIIAPRELAEINVNARTAFIPAAVLFLWAIGVVIASWKYEIRGLTASVALGFMATFASFIFMVITVAPQLTTEDLINYIRPGITKYTHIITIDFPQSVGFYTGKRVKIIAPGDEESLGISQLSPEEKKRWIYDGEDIVGELRRDFESTSPTYCITRNTSRKDEVAAMLRQLGDDAILIASNYRYIVIGNDAAAELTPPK